MVKSHAPADRLAAYEALVATNPKVERKGAKIPYTSRNGHMFSFLTESGSLVLRLPPDERVAFIAAHATRLHVAHGRVMQEFVEVPDALWRDPRALERYFAISYKYVGALPAKATTRPAKRAKKPAKRG